MRRLLVVLSILSLVATASAQDDFGIGFGETLTADDLNALLGGGGGNRGGRGNNLANLIPDPDLMTNQLKDLLKSENVPLDRDQERALKELLKSERESVERLVTTQFGNRGNNPRTDNNNNPATAASDLERLVLKHNTALLTEMKTLLTPDQVTLVVKAEKDKKKVCTVMLDVINFKRVEEQRNNAGFGPSFGGFEGGFGGFDGGFDGGFGGGGGPGGFGGGRGGRGGRGGFNNIELPDRANCTTRDSTIGERLAPIAQILSKGKKPLTGDQEVRFTGLVQDAMALLESELAANPQIANIVNNLNRDDTNTLNPQQLRNNIVNTIFQQLGIQTGPNGGNRGGRGGGGDGGGRGDTGRGRGGRPFNVESELSQRREALFDGIIALLNPNQQPVVRKLKYAEIKARGGVEEIRGILDEEGTPLTAEQRTTIQSFFDTAGQSIRQYAEELVTDEIAKAPVRELTPPAQDSRERGSRPPNPNNVNENPRAQQIVSKLLPQVSIRRAVIDKATMDSVMKVLTPAQVASYKLNSL